MSILDVFSGNAFSTQSLTAAVNMLPYQPNRLNFLFRKVPITDTHAVVEYKQGRLSVLMTAARGTSGANNLNNNPTRKAYSFPVPHIPHTDAVMADEVQSVRSFGDESRTETVSEMVNDKLGQMKQNMETTFEWHRMGAIKGTILDGDGSTTLFDLFTIFGLTQTTLDFDLGVSNPKTKCTALIRYMNSALGGTPFSGIHVFCGDAFWDALIVDSNVETAYQRWQDGRVLFENQVYAPFNFAGVTFENYRGDIGGSNWVADDEAYAVPLGVPDLFLHHMAPADYIETVNTRGMEMYAKQERMRMDKGIELEVQANPLLICTRPQACIKLTRT